MVGWGILLTGMIPLVMAWLASRGTTLVYAFTWAIGAWGMWVAALWPGLVDEGVPRYGALCMTACVAVAVLGARRPGYRAWNAVVAAFLAVILLPAVQARGGLRVEPMWALLLAVSLTMGLVNYMPTRLGPAIVMLGLGCGVELTVLLADAETGAYLEAVVPYSRSALASAPWLAFLLMRWRRPVQSEFDLTWLD